MKTYLINLPSPFLLDDKSNVPLGLKYVHSYLVHNGVDASIVDLAGKKESDWYIPLDGDVYGISFTTPQAEIAKRVSNLIPSSRLIVAGGVHARCAKASSIFEGSRFDVVVREEGEYAALQLATTPGVRGVPGTSYRDGNNVVQVRSGELEHDIDRFPHPIVDAIDHASYRCGVFTTDDGNTIRGAPIITSRGCPHNCAFCCSPKLYGRKVRFHSVEYVQDWIGDLANHGYTYYYIVDDTLLLNMDRLKGVCAALAGVKAKWRCCIRGDAATAEKLQLMYDAGCRQVDIGVESGSQKILDLVRKGERVTDNGEAVDLCHRIGIKVKACLIVGLPGETQLDVDLTKAFIAKHRPDSVTLCTFIPFPGCAIREHPEQFSYEIDPKAEYDQYYCCGSAGTGCAVAGEAKGKTLEFRRQLEAAIGVSATLSTLKRRKP